MDPEKSNPQYWHWKYHCRHQRRFSWEKGPTYQTTNPTLGRCFNRFPHKCTPNIDVPNLNEFLSDALTKLNRKVTLLLGLKVKTPWNGKERDRNAPQKHFRDRIQGIHCECEGAQTSFTAKLLKGVLISSAFQHRYRCDSRLVPTFDRHSSPYIREKIRRCMVQHAQFCKCVTSNACEGFQFPDIKNKKLKKLYVNESLIYLTLTLLM